MISLPEPYAAHLWGQDVDVYNARQMHAYAAAAVAEERTKLMAYVDAQAAAEIDRLRSEVERLKQHAVTLAETERLVERERCARVCESHPTYGDPVQGWFDLLAAAIRAGAGGEG